MIVMLPGEVEGVTGLKWDTTLPGEWKEVRRATKAKGLLATFFQVTNDSTKETVINYGTIVKEAPELAGAKRKVSLAGMLALSNTQGHLIAVERLPSEDDEAEVLWFCAVNNGQVISGTDVTGTTEEIAQQIAEYRELLPEDSAKIIGNAAQIEDVNATATSVFDYLDESLTNAAQIQGQSKSRVTRLIGVVAVGVVLALVTIGYMSFRPKKVERPKLTLQQIQAAQKKTALAALQKKKDVVKRSPAFEPTFEAVMEKAILPLPAFAGGWDLSKTSCSKGHCVSIYKNADMTPPEALERAAKPSCRSLTFDTEGQAATCTSVYRPVNIAQLREPWELNAKDRRRLLDSLMSITRQLAKDAAFELGDPVLVAVPNRQILDSKVLFKSGKWSLQVRAELAQPASELLYADGKPLIFNAIDFDWSKDSATIRGRYITTGDKP